MYTVNYFYRLVEFVHDVSVKAQVLHAYHMVKGNS